MAAVLARTIAVAARWRADPAFREPSLDAAYYLDWAREIAAGHLLSAGPVGVAEPYLLNPLYAWSLAPLTLFGDAFQLAVLVFQIALGGATAWLAAAAARRHGGVLATWVAGAAVALSAVLVQLTTHVGVATLAAFLIAGAVRACSPPAASARSTGTAREHGGLGPGLWLGVGALARPVTLLALPFVAWLERRRRGGRAALLTLAVFGACAGVSFARNVIVSGETVTFTAANGLNLHLGQNALARGTRSMLSDDFHFDPVLMHVDARHRVGLALGRQPTRSEISAWYRDRTLRELLEHPAAVLGFAAQKARWFLTPREPPSSADLALDVRRVPWLRVGFLPTWLLAVLGIAGAWAARRDRALLLGAGALVLAHLAACTLAFPLSQYRAPAVPALAVLAGAGAAALARAGRRERLRAGGLAVALGALAWLPPQPDPVAAVEDVNAAVDALRAGDGEAALALADRALAAEPEWSAPLRVKSDAYLVLGRLPAALTWVERKVARTPWDVPARRAVAELLVDLRRPEDARAAAQALVRDFPWSAEARRTRGAIRAWTGDIAGAREDLRWARDHGAPPQERVLRLIDPPDGE